MKVCKKGALYLQIMQGGLVRPCDFTVSPDEARNFGSLMEKDLYEIYHGKQAEELRKLIENGKNFNYCRQDVCRNIASGNTDFMVDIEELPDYPWALNLAYDTTCNYQCKSCIFHKYPRPSKDTLQVIEEKLKPALPHVKHLITNGCGELFASASIMKILAEWEPISPIEECCVELMTNGSLFNEKNWKKIENIGRFYVDVEITIHSFDEKTYQYLSGTKMSIQNIIDNLHFVKDLRQRNVINRLELATVVQERNFRELPEFTHRCLEEFDADLVRIRGFEPWGAMNKDIEWFFNVRNPFHPYYEEYLDIMKDPVFQNPKVFDWMGHSSSLQGDLPSKANYEMLKTWHLADNPGEILMKYLQDKQIHGIIFYGISEMGNLMFKEFAKCGIKVTGILDKYTPAESWNSLQVIRPTKEVLPDLKEAVFITLLNKAEFIEKDLRRDGYTGTIIKLQDIL